MRLRLLFVFVLQCRPRHLPAAAVLLRSAIPAFLPCMAFLAFRQCSVSFSRKNAATGLHLAHSGILARIYALSCPSGCVSCDTPAILASSFDVVVGLSDFW